jgi:hypothetical protein
MARIRSIKPEFPQSESMGRVSRDARLLFILLWTIADDSGRTRAASRMLASLLFPYDDDARLLIDEWLAELDAAGCIVRYEVQGQRYLEICNWLKHQRIDKPSKPQHPSPREGSRVFAESSETFLVGREGKGEEGKGEDHSCASADADAPTRADPIPYEAIVDAYNTTMTKLPKVRELTTKRRTAIRRAWQESKTRQSLDFWRAYFEECADDAWRNGTGPYGGAHANWRPDFDFLIRSDQVTKVYEAAMQRMEAA